MFDMSPTEAVPPQCLKTPQQRLQRGLQKLYKYKHQNERLKAPHPARIQMPPPIFLYLQRTLPFWENNHKSYVEPNIVEELMRE